jgi:Tfp pilus assembly protein PilO
MKISPREMMLAWVTGLIALFGVSYLLAAPKFKEWSEIITKREEATKKIELTERLIGQNPAWESKLSELRRKLPKYPADKDVTADLLIRIEKLASANGLILASRDVDKETQTGDMYELAANCKWEGKLEPLVRFLFDLQQEDAILDVSQLLAAPNEKRVLKGSFTVYCSYSRIKSAAAVEKSETKGNQP